MAVDLPTVVLTAQAETRPSPMAALGVTLGAALGALRSWEAAHGVRAVALPEAGPPPTLAPDPQRVERIARIEAGLKEARAVLDLADTTRVDALRAALALVYGEARAHPEDPEAGSLVAETLRTLARVEALAGNADDSAALLSRARVLDGGRMLGLSEGSDVTVAPTPPVTFTLMLDGAPSGAKVHVDGPVVPIASALSLKLSPGEHHLRVVLPGANEALDGPTLYASFFVVGGGSDASLRIRVAPPPLACSARDLEPALTALAADADARFDVACARWARVVRVGETAIQARICTATACGEKVGWVSPPNTNGDGPPPGKGGGSSVWRSTWTYVAIGAAVVVASGVAAWRLGAFDRGETSPPTWRWEGVGGR